MKPKNPKSLKWKWKRYLEQQMHEKNSHPEHQMHEKNNHLENKSA
jgi:hypothetical protein